MPLDLMDWISLNVFVVLLCLRLGSLCMLALLPFLHRYPQVCVTDIAFAQCEPYTCENFPVLGGRYYSLENAAALSRLRLQDRKAVKFAPHEAARALLASNTV